MNKTRLEAFSDGVIAIILTIMVLELKVPKEHTLAAMVSLWPVWTAYAMSYLFVFMVWLNHHDIFAELDVIDRRVLLANGLLLFAASLIPFATAFAGEAHWNATVPVAAYGLVMLVVSLAFANLRRCAARCAPDAAAATAHRREMRKSLLFAAVFLCGCVAAHFEPRAALLGYAGVLLVSAWFRRRRPAG